MRERSKYRKEITFLNSFKLISSFISVFIITNDLSILMIYFYIILSCQGTDCINYIFFNIIPCLTLIYRIRVIRYSTIIYRIILVLLDLQY